MYDDLKEKVREFVRQHRPEKVKSKGEESVVEGFYDFKELDNGFMFRYYRKRYKEIIDPYTKEKLSSAEIVTTPILVSKEPYIMIILSSDIYLVNRILGSLNEVINEDMRTSIEFGRDFIEYCNTAPENDPNLNLIFGDDLINTARGGGKGGYRFFEEYPDTRERLENPKVAPRDVTGFKVILPDNVVDVKIYPSGKITFERIPDPESDLDTIIRVIARLKKAYEDYLSTVKGKK